MNGYDRFTWVGIIRFFQSSDIRESISLFAEMISKINETKLNQPNPKIDDIAQNRAYRDAGGKFLSLLQSASSSSNVLPMFLEGESFGSHLVDIAKAFSEMALHELKYFNSKNQNSNPPKQSRRIEIKNIEKLPDDVYEYYKGLIKYGVFIRDYRGKSIRGKAVPRLYLRGLVIPYFTLTFSKRDNISLTWEEFCELLRNPSDFSKAYIKKKKIPELDKSNQIEIWKK